MATYSRENLDALVNNRIERRIGSQFVTLHPLYNLLAAQEPGRSPYAVLGQPGHNQVFGSASMDPLERENGMLSSDRQFRIVKFESEGPTGVESGGATPVAATRADENIATFRMRYSHVMKAVECNKHVLEDMANQGTAIGMASYVTEMLAEPWEAFTKGIHQRWWTDAPTGTEQNKQHWTKFIGLQAALTDNNVYGGVDRSVATGLSPNEINAATEFNSTVVSLDMIRKVNSGFTKVSDNSTFIGLKQRSGDGSGAQCWILGPGLWQELADQIESRYVINKTDLPAHGLGGFRYDAIYYDGVYIINDHLCPAGEMYGINLDSWLLEVDGRHNMRWLGFNDESRSSRGGDYVEWGHLSMKARLTCRLPWQNVRIYNLTA